MTSTGPATFTTRCLTMLSLVASLALGACANDDAKNGSETPSAAAVFAADCVTFAAQDKVNVCHSTGVAEAPYSLIQVNTETCKSAHADHESDFVASDDAGCTLAAKVSGPTCKQSGQACSVSKAAECCSFTCLCPLGAKRCTCG